MIGCIKKSHVQDAAAMATGWLTGIFVADAFTGTAGADASSEMVKK